MHNILDQSPPILGSWKNIYWLVIGGLLVEVLIFYWITVVFTS